MCDNVRAARLLAGEKVLQFKTRVTLCGEDIRIVENGLYECVTVGNHS